MENEKYRLCRTFSILGVLLVSSLLLIVVAHASSLDSSFDPNADRTVGAIEIQPDGKILIGGGFASVGGGTRSRIARLNDDGTLDTTFSAIPNVSVTAIAVQPDGKILIAGVFTTVNDLPRRRLARLEADGTLDYDFDANVVGSSMNVIKVQADGKILIGGNFTSVGGVTRNNLARLNTDGTLDSSFNPDVDNTVHSIALQADNKIVIGGGFNSVAGTDDAIGISRNGVARLNIDGNLDAAFDPNADNDVKSVAVQADGKILIGGGFTSVGGVTRNRIARLEVSDGTPDDSFSPDVTGNVESIAVQTNGQIQISGQFITVNEISRSRVALLNADGSVDPDFDSGLTTNGFVWSILIQKDGKTLLGGYFNSVDNTTRNNIARIISSAATESVVVRQDGSSVNWQRGGAAPEVIRTTLEISLDGTNWMAPVAGQRTNGGWQFDGLNIQQLTLNHLRLRGFYGSSQSITETLQQVLLPRVKNALAPIYLLLLN